MAIFFHDVFLFDDPVGFGIWRQEHQYEHTQFVTTLRAAVSSRLVPDYDIASWDDSEAFRTRWLVTHEAVHEQLRTFTGVSGVNLSDVDLTKESEFYDWLDVHRAEHILLRSALGLPP